MQTRLDRKVDAMIVGLQHRYNADVCRAFLEEVAASDRPFVNEVTEKSLQDWVGDPFYEIETRLKKIDAALAENEQ